MADDTKQYIKDFANKQATTNKLLKEIIQALDATVEVGDTQTEAINSVAFEIMKDYTSVSAEVLLTAKGSLEGVGKGVEDAIVGYMNADKSVAQAIRKTGNEDLKRFLIDQQIEKLRANEQFVGQYDKQIEALQNSAENFDWTGMATRAESLLYPVIETTKKAVNEMRHAMNEWPVVNRFVSDAMVEHYKTGLKEIQGVFQKHLSPILEPISMLTGPFTGLVKSMFIVGKTLMTGPTADEKARSKAIIRTAEILEEDLAMKKGDRLRKDVSKKKGGLLDGILDKFGIKGVGGLLSGGGAMLMGAIGSLVIGAVWAFIDGIRGAMKFGGVSGFVSGMLGGMGSGIKNMFANAGKWALVGVGIGAIGGPIGMLVGGGIGAFLGGILGYFGGEKIHQAIEGFGMFISDIWNWITDKIKTAYRSVWEGMVWYFENIIMFPVNALKWVWDKLTGIAKDLNKDSESIIMKTVKDIIKVPVDAVVSIWEKLTGFVSDMIDKLPSLTALFSGMVDDLLNWFKPTDDRTPVSIDPKTGKWTVYTPDGKLTPEQEQQNLSTKSVHAAPSSSGPVLARAAAQGRSANAAEELAMAVAHHTNVMNAATNKNTEVLNQINVIGASSGDNSRRRDDIPTTIESAPLIFATQSWGAG